MDSNIIRDSHLGIVFTPTEWVATKAPFSFIHLYFQAYFTIDSRRLASMHRKSNARNSKLLYCVKQFNLDPKKGISDLEKAGFIPSPAPAQTPVSSSNSIIKFIVNQI